MPSATALSGALSEMEEHVQMTLCLGGVCASLGTEAGLCAIHRGWAASERAPLPEQPLSDGRVPRREVWQGQHEQAGPRARHARNSLNALGA